MLNRDLEKISEWAKKWKVIFHPGKSKDLIYCNNKFLFNSPPLIFNNTFIERVHEHKHLGVYFSSSLSWARQIHEVCLRSNRKLAVLRSVKYLDRSTLDILYKVTVRSVIEYGLIVYYHTLNKTEAARLHQIQYRAAKLCTGALHLTSQVKLENDLAWETIADRAKFLGLSVFNKIHKHETRPLVRTCMSKINTNKTRGYGNYVPFSQKGVKFSNSFFPYFTRLWNSQNQKVKDIHDITDFKLEIKKQFKPRKQRHYSRTPGLARHFDMRIALMGGPHFCSYALDFRDTKL
jgi:hypothetical protein